jgi:hypothetical protein
MASLASTRPGTVRILSLSGYVRLRMKLCLGAHRRLLKSWCKHCVLHVHCSTFSSVCPQPPWTLRSTTGSPLTEHYGHSPTLHPLVFPPREGSRHGHLLHVLAGKVTRRCVHRHLCSSHPAPHLQYPWGTHLKFSGYSVMAMLMTSSAC